MPNDLNIGWFALGSFLLLCGLIGGEFKIFGAEFSSKISNKWIRILCLFLSLICFSIIYNPIKNLPNFSFKSNLISSQIHISQYSEPNYSPFILKFLIGEINKNNKNLNFIYHDRKNEFVDSSSSTPVFKQIKADFPIVGVNKIFVGLVSFRLENNYFSIKKNNYSVISTVDFDSDLFNPGKDTLLIYKYILHQSINHFFITKSNINFHKTNEAQGCIFDFKSQKKEIINTINNPSICNEHRNVLLKIFNESDLKEIEDLLKFFWLGKTEVKNNLKILYNLKY